MNSEQKKLLRQLGLYELSRRSYRDYLEFVHNGRYFHMAHTKYLAERLQKIADGEQKHLIVEMPPRSGKSITITETFPSYYIGRNPDKRVITAAYSDGLARKFGRLNRNKLIEFGTNIFGVSLANDNGTVNNWGIDDSVGGMIATGIGGSITGEGADCFPEGTMIDTEIGKVDIRQLHEKENPPRVLSYNHVTGKLEYKDIQVTRRKKADELTKISTVSGNEIISTKEHRYYDFERGYRKANIFRSGDKLTVQAIQKEHTLCCVQKEKERKRDILFRLLPFSTKENSDTRVHIVWETLRKTILRIQQSIEKRANRFLLFGRMFQKTSFLQKFKKLLLLWGYEEKRQQILQQRMYAERQTEEQKENRMPSMFYNVLPAFTQNHLLFEGMCKPFTFQKNERGEQQSLQRRNKLFERVFGNETYNFKEGQLQVQSVSTRRKTHDNIEWQKEDQPSHSSHERRCNGQHKRKSDSAMCELSYHTPQIESDTVRYVKSYEQPNTIVYDIQVADNHNFFANGVLVHNCLIIDDPIKNNEEAQSQTMRDKVWDEWETTLSTRLHKGASVIVVMTRWHEDDFVGRLLERSPYNWERIRMPAIAEDDNDLLGREVGTSLAPELGYDEEWAEIKKKEVGSKTWASLYQQRPSASEGNIFNRNWWRYYESLPRFFDEQIISWDLTFKDNNDNDYVVGQVWGRKGADYYLIDQVRDKMDFPTTVTAVRNLSNKYPRVSAKLIEDKANGPAVIATLKREVNGIIPVNPQGSKVARAQAVTPFIESGNVFLPKHKEFSYDLIEEAAAFPNGKHDDQVDSASQALSRLASRKQAGISSVNIW